MAKRQRMRTRPGAVATSTAQDRIWLWLVLGAVAVVGLVGGLLYLGNREQATTNMTIEGLKTFPDPGRGHQEGDLHYAQPVPVGGVHNPEWLNCGIYDQPVRPENAIHSMEHGAVWIAYRPDLPADQVELLRDIVRQKRSQRNEALVVLAPNPDITVPIVA